jgi:hypothetical protein
MWSCHFKFSFHNSEFHFPNIKGGEIRIAQILHRAGEEAIMHMILWQENDLYKKFTLPRFI